MNALERTYFIDELQLIFLLSLVDERALVGFGATDAGQVALDTWEKVAVSLLDEGRLAYDQQMRLTISPELAALLKSAKDARRVLAVYRKQARTPAELIYFGPGGPVCLGMHGPSEYRLWRLSEWSEQTLAQEALLPRRMPSDADAAVLRELDEPLRVRLAALERDALPWREPVFAWGQYPGVCAALELYQSDGTALQRWIWVDGAGEGEPGCVLVQTPDRCHAVPDAPEIRRQVVEVCRLEDQHGREKA